jgi:hypothetical protein
VILGVVCARYTDKLEGVAAAGEALVSDAEGEWRAIALIS